VIQSELTAEDTDVGKTKAMYAIKVSVLFVRFVGKFLYFMALRKRAAPAAQIVTPTFIVMQTFASNYTTYPLYSVPPVLSAVKFFVQDKPIQGLSKTGPEKRKNHRGH
jgi:hypothetical protein